MTPPRPDSAPSHALPPHPSRAPDGVHSLLDRPVVQRAREYQYRFAQATVFGLPVIALQGFGRSLGGPEADRWVAVFQAVLAGWVVYVGAAGMLFDGMLWLARRRVTADLIPSFAAVALYLAGLVPVLAHLLTGTPSPFPPRPFHWVVLVLIAWTGCRWWWTHPRHGRDEAQ